MKEYVQKIRYPPFEYSHMNAKYVPITEVIIESEKEIDTEFKIGDENSWFAEWRIKSDEDENLPRISSIVTSDTLPFLMKNRNGWYIGPDPLHLVSRKIITPTVIILILSIFIHAIEPGLLELGLISKSFAGSYRFGPLDYPKLLLFAFPIFLLPLIFRMIANFRDIKKQNDYKKNPLSPPDINLTKGENSISIEITSMPSDIVINRARIQVGIAVPERKKIMEALNRKEWQQPSPGMSTEVPEKRISTGDEMGTGVGEAMPMAVQHSRVLLLETLRVLEPGEWNSNIKLNSIIKLKGPEIIWPGSIYSSLIAIHWELILDGERSDGTIMKWIRPIKVSQNMTNVDIETMPVRSGRIEMSDY